MTSSDQSRTRTERFREILLLLVAEVIVAIAGTIPDVDHADRDPLPEEEFPECLYCDRQLGIGVAPGRGPAWKCPVHGTFHSEEVDANVLRGMQTVVAD